MIFVEGLDDGRPEANGPGARAVEHHCHPVVAICARGSLTRRPSRSMVSPSRAPASRGVFFDFTN